MWRSNLTVISLTTSLCLIACSSDTGKQQSPASAAPDASSASPESSASSDAGTPAASASPAPDAGARMQPAAKSGESAPPSRPATTTASAGSGNAPAAPKGDAERGRVLLLNNGTPEAPYLSCGIPKSLVGTLRALGADPFGNGPKLADRIRGNAELPYSFSYARTRAGLEVVTTNCLLCHAAQLGGALVIGLGNPNLDFTGDSSGGFGLGEIAQELLRLTLNDDETAEVDRFSRLGKAGADVPRPDTVGMNPADVTFAVLAAHRDAKTLTWHDAPAADAQLDRGLMYTDVPALWNVHRRERLFYSGFGTGNHARTMMAASLMCLEDTDEAAAIDAYYPDIEAYLMSLRAPRYEEVAQRPLDTARVQRGGKLYAKQCADCHGDETHAPREDVPADEVGTDPAYAVATSQRGDGGTAYYFEFFNRSWYGTHGAAAQLTRAPEPSYSAPPLQGVWATAPYFHNGSVPTLDAVLDPSLRPAIFRRSLTPQDYDFERVGWPYEVVSKKGDDRTVYDATRPQYLNSGHSYGSELSAEERRDLLEYLKSL